ncbi:PLP-dependent aminotransferase family protein [Pseudoroseomonas cervicalis]|uniref:aminotransferase-like domain-containing protein n=1 Tax=Teichococcus cervicalis TaxID=204525 RepID=UPI0022F18BA9|nr:PLP-dependent aminotransferase family protein [Pseudoroseomonas cervicalis]WBV42257.1 PLP-dependent aminotransferase family protein [Pseudoroseomonas cervicalis]
MRRDRAGAAPSPGFWQPELPQGAGPLYRAIADAMEADLAAGRLAPGARLPPQRRLAAALGIDLTTVSRAYAEAARRGLVEGRVGQGSYLRDPAGPRPGAPAAAPPLSLAPADLSMNLPPCPADPLLAARLAQAGAAWPPGAAMAMLLRYQVVGGSAAERAAGLAWLAPRLGPLPAERLLLCPGAQGAMLAVLMVLTRPGDTICAEALTYPGFRALAAHLGLRLAPVAMDADGLLPEAFEAQCRRQPPRALYCTPTLHNPTATTLPLARRQALLEIARRHQVPVIEDDAYGALPEAPPPPLAALAPGQVFHIASLSKCMGPALRLAYLVLPEPRWAPRLGAALRALSGMASPIGGALASAWIQDGSAAALLQAIRREAAARRALAARLLAPALPPGTALPAEGFHLWLPLPPGWSRGELLARWQGAGNPGQGPGLVGSDAFALEAPPEAVRLGLGAPETEALRQGLEALGDLLARPPAMSSLVV